MSVIGELIGSFLAREIVESNRRKRDIEDERLTKDIEKDWEGSAINTERREFGEDTRIKGSR